MKAQYTDLIILKRENSQFDHEEIMQKKESFSISKESL
jgi:hypothetical protein